MSDRKPDSERANRNKPVYPTTYIIWDGKTRGEPLPPRPDKNDWCPETLEWWDFVRNSAQAMLMHPSDWFMLRNVAMLHHQMYSTKKVLNKSTDEYEEVSITPGELKALASEIRTQLDPYGFTHQSRVRYGINIVTPEDLETEAVQEQIKSAHHPPVIVDYRKQYGG